MRWKLIHTFSQSWALIVCWALTGLCVSFAVVNPTSYHKRECTKEAFCCLDQPFTGISAKIFTLKNVYVKWWKYLLLWSSNELHCDSAFGFWFYQPIVFFLFLSFQSSHGSHVITLVFLWIFLFLYKFTLIARQQNSTGQRQIMARAINIFLHTTRWPAFCK